MSCAAWRRSDGHLLVRVHQRRLCVRHDFVVVSRETAPGVGIEPDNEEQVVAVRAVAPIWLQQAFAHRFVQQAHVGQAQVHRGLLRV